MSAAAACGCGCRMRLKKQSKFIYLRLRLPHAAEVWTRLKGLAKMEMGAECMPSTWNIIALKMYRNPRVKGIRKSSLNLHDNSSWKYLLSHNASLPVEIHVRKNFLSSFPSNSFSLQNISGSQYSPFHHVLGKRIIMKEIKARLMKLKQSSMQCAGWMMENTRIAVS